MKEKLFYLIEDISLSSWMPIWLGNKIWELRYISFFDKVWDEIAEIEYEL